ncbi:MAG: rod-binding protein [Xanthobacteraceae bacterium]
MTTGISSALGSNIDPAMLRTAGVGGRSDPKVVARANAQDFEATFLNLMFQHMFTETNGDGPVGGGTGVGVWRSFLTDEFAKSFAKQGGIGLADQVYQSLLSHQEAARAT